MEEQIIELNPTVDQFKMIYFKNGQGNLLQNNLTKRLIRVTVIFILVTILLYLWGLKRPEQSWLFILGLLFTATVFTFLLVKASKFYSWKKEVNEYLNKVSQINRAILTLKQDAFEIQMDERIVLQKLNSIRKIEIEPDFITVYGENENFLFPSRTMDSEDFAQLIKYFRK